MKRKLLVLLVAVSLLMASSFVSAGSSGLPPVDWSQYQSLEVFVEMHQAIAEEYPELATSYSIGKTWQDADLWCTELTSPNGKPKTGVAVFGNIHGGEKESGNAALYFMWWLATNYGTDDTATLILDNYKVYVVPLINPDGYDYSMKFATLRHNIHPTDLDGDGIPDNDVPVDTDGDGFIAQVYTGAPDSSPSQRIRYSQVVNGMTRPAWEGIDANGNGVPGSDPYQGSGIDMNRNFDYEWGASGSSGPYPASEPEVKAVQDFLLALAETDAPVAALATMHTGIQCVLWPWGYTSQRPPHASFMESVAEQMTAAFYQTTGRRMYYMQSYDDYFTRGELIDWGYGALGIPSYTVEVYQNGTGTYRWGSTISTPPDIWIYKGDWEYLPGVENVWFRIPGSVQRLKMAPYQMDLMMEGVKDSLVKMVLSAPSGAPVLTVPDDIVLEATSSAGAVANFSASAIHYIDGTVPVTFSQDPGTVFPLGTTTVTCTATDQAGRTATGTFTVTVNYSWSGVVEPISSKGNSTFKVGSTIPVKFRLTGESAAITDATVGLYVDDEPALSTSAAGENLFRYDPDSDEYIFNLNTKGLDPGAHVLRIDFGDGTSYTVMITLK